MGMARAPNNRQRVEIALSLTEWRTVDEIFEIQMHPKLTRNTIHRHLLNSDKVDLQLRSNPFTSRKQVWEYRLLSRPIVPHQHSIPEEK